MIFLVSISAIYIIFFLIVLFMGIFFNIDIKIQAFKWALIFFGISYATLAFYINPPYSWDLYRLYNEIDLMRFGGLNYVINSAIYKDLFVTNYLFYFVSLLPSNGFLPFITILIEFFIFTYISVDFKKKNKDMSTMIYAIIFLLYFTLADISLSLSGIRNVLAFSICGLALYIDFIQGKKGILKWFLYIVPIFIHPSVIIILILRLFIIFKKISFKFSFLLLLWVIFLPQITQYLKYSPIKVLNIIGSLMNDYSNIQVNYDIRILCINIILVSTLLVSSLYLLKNQKDIIPLNHINFIRFFILYCLVTLGSITNLILFNRLLFGLAYIFIPIIYYLFKSVSKIKYKFYYFIFMSCSFICLMFQIYHLYIIFLK